MSTGVRVSLEEGLKAAREVLALITPAVERVNIAGSIRRGRLDVGDIEIVAVPQVDTEPDGMWGERRINRLTERLDMLIRVGKLRAHPTDPKRGERYSKLIEPASGLQIDLFSASATTFGLIYLIRTGPAEYSQRFVTDLRHRSLHASGGELHRGSLGCGSYTCPVVPTVNEEDVYAAAGWAYVEPAARA